MNVKEGKVCSAVLSLHHTCKIELGHKDLTLLRKLELLSSAQWGDRGLVVLTVVLLIHSDWLVQLYLSTATQLQARSTEPVRLRGGVANANHIPHMNIFPTSGNKCPGHKYITAESCSYVRYALGIRSEFHIGMLVEKSTFPQRWRDGRNIGWDKVFSDACAQTTQIRLAQ